MTLKEFFRPTKGKISTPLGIILILLSAILVGVLIWQYLDNCQRCHLTHFWMIGSCDRVCLPMPSPISKEEVTITTDKTEYEQGEMVKITVKNNLDKKIWFATGFNWPFTTDQIQRLGCEVGYILIYPHPEMLTPSLSGWIDGAEKLEPSKEFIYYWDQKRIQENGERIQTEAGKYKIQFDYYTFDYSYAKSSDKMDYYYDEDFEFRKTIYSNEFTIKERESIGDIHLTIKSDKQVYEVGEPILITVKLKNISKYDYVYLIPDVYDNIFRFWKVETENGKLERIKPYAQGTLRQTDYAMLSAGKEISYEADITTIWKFMPGEYRITANYKGQNWYKNEDGSIAEMGGVFYGTLTSNTITIEVVEKKLTTQSKNLDKATVESWGRQKGFFIKGNFEIIDWEEAKNSLLKEKIRGGKQYHTGWLTIYTLDGKKYLVKQPKMDALWEFIEEKGIKLEGFGTE